MGNVYLSLNPPKLRLFSTVHLTVDDQDIGKASDVASLHLNRSRAHNFNTQDKGTSCCRLGAMGRWDSLWADTSHSFHTTPGCSAPGRCSSSGSPQSRTPLLCLMNKRILEIISRWGSKCSLCLRCLADEDAWIHLESCAQGNAWWTAALATSAPSLCHSDTDCCSPPHIQTASRWPTHQRSPENWTTNTQGNAIFSALINAQCLRLFPPAAYLLLLAPL